MFGKDQFPHNEVVDLFNATPQELWPKMQEELCKIDRLPYSGQRYRQSPVMVEERTYGRATGSPKNFETFVQEMPLPEKVEAPSKHDSFSTDGAKRQGYYATLVANERQQSALESIADDWSKGRNICANDLRRLNRTDVEALKTGKGQALEELLVRHIKTGQDDVPEDVVIWPCVPYHYGMGRIREYEMWLAKLSEKEREQEVAASKARYASYYRSVARLVARRTFDIAREPDMPQPDEPFSMQDVSRFMNDKDLYEKLVMSGRFKSMGRELRMREQARERSYGRELSR